MNDEQEAFEKALTEYPGIVMKHVARDFWKLALDYVKSEQEPVGEIQLEDMGRPFNALQVRVHFYKEVPPTGTKLFAHLAPAQPAVVCKGISKSGCNYLAQCDTVCNKCGEIHAHHQMVAMTEAQPAVVQQLEKALTYCRQKIAYMQAHGEWYSPGRAIEMADEALAALKAVKENGV